KNGHPADSWQILLRFANCSIATINYFSNGHRSLPKETIEVNTAGKSLKIDNFRRLSCVGFGAGKEIKLWKQDKGQTQCALEVVQSIKDGRPAPIAFAELHEVMQTCLDLWNQVQKSAP
ncbi:MAG TPA: hypothetical protein PK011_00535, partial [Marinagarivorans sp.]|nr:hypothetical protein [Marinagarivorans sp.]